jgi:hypothetical protein
VASRSRRKPAAAKAVFINCPFDDEFKPILRAMVFTIISSGYHPRCALDVSDGADIRVGKIAGMIGECDWVIHDLSRVEITDGLPRFNMAMELGLHLGARLLGEGRHRRKRALILDTEAHRYDKTLSDISGQDIKAHGNKPDEAIRCVRNWLSAYNSPPLPGAEAMKAITGCSKPRSALSIRSDRFVSIPTSSSTLTSCMSCTTGSFAARWHQD